MKRERKPKILGQMVIALFIVVLLVNSLLTTWQDWQDWRDSDSWAKTTSTHFAINHKSSRVSYSYLVNGQSYTGTRVRFFEGWLYDGLTDLHRDVNEVTIYYDTQAPQRAVLVKDIDLARVATQLFTLVYCALAFLLPFLFIGLSFWWLRRAFRG